MNTPENNEKKKSSFWLLDILNLNNEPDFIIVEDWTPKYRILISIKSLTIKEIIQAIRFAEKRKSNLDRCHNNGILSRLQWTYKYYLKNDGIEAAKEDLRMTLTFTRSDYRSRNFSQRTFYRLKKWVHSILPKYDFSLWKQSSDHCPNCFHNLDGVIKKVVK